ncbi:hypothetical protein KR044_002916 [Drosophila immigrans]|nr:hypothetical protein KR044_002916 [Drosophila immigrans]
MEIFSTLVQIFTTFRIILFVLSIPLLLFVAVLTKIYECFTTKPSKGIVGEVAVVTGAAHGLGRAIALELAKIGCHIAVVDIDIEGAEETVRKIHEISEVKAKAYKVNVASFGEVTDLRENVERDLGLVTILINNAGILLLRNSLNPEPQDVQRMIDVNLTSHFWTKSVFLPTMKRLRRGYLVIVSSLAGTFWSTASKSTLYLFPLSLIAGLFPLAYNSSYSATKFGACGHMKAIRLELEIEKQHDIHVSTVMPLFMDTNDEVCDMAKVMKVNRLYPVIKGKAAARRIVEGMLAGEREIIIPSIFNILYRVLK